MACTYIRNVGSAFLILFYIRAIGSITYTGVLAISEDAGVVRKADRETGVLIESNTSVQWVHKVIILSSVSIKRSRCIIKANLLNIMKSMLRVPSYPCPSNDPNIQTNLDVVRKRRKWCMHFMIFYTSINENSYNVVL